MTDFVLVGCVKSKADERREARDLYTSPLFRKRRRVAEAGEWGILSAEHGFIWPTAELDPYDTHISDVDAEAWGRDVIGSLVPILSRRENPTVTIYAGGKYVSPLKEPLERMGYRVREPCAGLRPGERQQELDRLARSAENQRLTEVA